ncbi:MAG: hypothetical protein ACI89J_002264, partial [Hyphomicrobiaceae bacterium]
ALIEKIYNCHRTAFYFAAPALLLRLKTSSH